MLTAPIEVITSTQAADMAASKSPQDVFRGCYRVKPYVKPDEFRLGFDPRKASFPQPYQVASHATGLPWDVTNRVFMGQLSGCNLACPWCYLGGGTEEVWVTPDDYLGAFNEYNLHHPEHRAGVLRIDGGEPMLHQEWVEDLVRKATSAGTYCWVNTNATIAPYARLRRAMAATENAGVNLCFKPGVPGVCLEQQLDVMQAWLEGGADCYWYWPSDDGQDVADCLLLLDALEKLRDINENAPLRLTVIQIKGYQTSRERGYDAKPDVLAHQCAVRRRFLDDWLAYNYAPELLWQPSHLIQLY